MQKLKQNIRAGLPYFGVLLFIVAVRFAVRMPLPASSAEQPDNMVEAAKMINAMAPMMVDEETEIMNAVGWDKTLIYNYRFINVSPQMASQREVRAVILEGQSAVVRQACSTPDTRRLFDLGATLGYAYHYSDYTFIHRFDVTSADCP